MLERCLQQLDLFRLWWDLHLQFLTWSISTHWILTLAWSTLLFVESMLFSWLFCSTHWPSSNTVLTIKKNTLTVNCDKGCSCSRCPRLSPLDQKLVKENVKITWLIHVKISFLPSLVPVLSSVPVELGIGFTFPSNNNNKRNPNLISWLLLTWFWPNSKVFGINYNNNKWNNNNINISAITT